MQQSALAPSNSNALTNFFRSTPLSSQQHTLGEIVFEILAEGKNLNHKSLCSKLLQRVELVSKPEDKQHYYSLIALLLES